MNILIIRLSSLGDVVMTIPIIYPLAESNPNDDFYLLSLPQHEQLFEIRPKNLHFIPFETKGRHKGFKGIIRLFQELRPMKFDRIADIHGVLRSFVLITLFACFTKVSKIKTINKGRWKKYLLTRQKNKKLSRLTDTGTRYADTLAQVGVVNHQNIPFKSLLERPDFDKSKRYRIGIAPFAKYQEKCYPQMLMELVIEKLSSRSDVELFFYGGGESESRVLELWAERYPHAQSMVGKLTMSEELKHIASLNIMVAMDSANMHLASVVGTPVISIWGATHPYAGFYGWGQHEENAIQMDLPCRPCSVFGNKKCYKENIECMRAIPPATILKRIDIILSQLNKVD